MDDLMMARMGINMYITELELAKVAAPEIWTSHKDRILTLMYVVKNVLRRARRVENGET